MEVHGDNRNRIEDEMWNRVEKCILRLKKIEDIFLKDERMKGFHTQAKKKISIALELVNGFTDSSEKKEDAAEEENRVNEAIEDAEQYLELDIFQAFASIVEKGDQEIKELKEKINKKIVFREDASRDEWTHILHLSDLHFGIYTNTEDEEQNRYEFFQTVEKRLFAFLKNYIKENHKIDIVAITGDISFCNREEGYYDFKDWLERLCSNIDVDIENHVIMCPGNHDKKCEGKNRDEDGLNLEKCEEGEVGELMTIDKIRERQEQFQFFNDVCKKLKMEPLENFGTRMSKRAVPYVMGTKKIDGIHFVVLNSAWNSYPRDEKNGSDHGKLLLGRRPIKIMFDNVQISEEEMTIVLFHHPLAWLHEEEIRAYGNDQDEPSAALVRQSADVILNGHVHGGIEPPDILANKTVVFGGGTLYTNDSYLNQFEIISVNRTKHFCQQTVVTYNRREKQRQHVGWELTGGNHPPLIYYGIYRDARELIAKYTLGEISWEEAMQAALDRSNEVGLRAFQDLFEKTKFRQIRECVEEEASNTREESMGQEKAMVKGRGEGEKES